MLALSRKKGEALMINNDIEITVLDIKGEQVKIGISAPKEVPVYRKEVYIQIQEANKEASANMEGMEHWQVCSAGNRDPICEMVQGKRAAAKGCSFPLF